ncbi:MAPEG family protein [Sedimentimonas flavescens]|uniref:MAPEG family protein n=1 Tax=Sedimentimonas flavescens TaxID=2851012 RepID=UPI001C4A4535|nr:MAPEG family protein [Sedimentimonas flavescens]MBW0156530.1 MAPEG family protein [Sedimentimonas flavescens]MCT2539021.1 MAPEG family protein [Sedimentimonas flavescens]WBL32298.1 MAPEG family protein [Sinirhodobacter sp. HNIBRBA609]
MITPLYALPLTALFIVLSARVINYRKAQRISLGDGDDPELRGRVRAHGNCAEFAPMGLVLLLMAELAQAPAPALHFAGTALLTGRVLHAWAIGWRGPFAARVAGMVLTFLSLAAAALAAVLA